MNMLKETSFTILIVKIFLQFRFYLGVCLIVPCISYAKVPCDTIIDGVVLHGSCKGILKHGEFIGYYPNGMVAWNVHFKNDLLHGKFIHFYPNGNIHFSGSYKNGVLSGAFKQYNQHNQILNATFKKGVLHNWLYVIQDDKKLQILKYYYGKLIQKHYIY